MIKRNGLQLDIKYCVFSCNEDDYLDKEKHFRWCNLETVICLAVNEDHKSKY